MFCLIHDRDLRYSVDHAEQLVLAVARGDRDAPEIAESIRSHLR